MQDKDSEALRNQRRRRKRIARMKHTIIAIIAGWIILSMILIIFLLVRTRNGGLAFNGTASPDFVEEIENADFLQKGTDGVRRLRTGLEPLQNFFLIERDVGLLEVRIVEADLFDKTVVARFAVVDDDGAINRVVTLAKTSETDNCGH